MKKNIFEDAYTSMLEGSEVVNEPSPINFESATITSYTNLMNTELTNLEQQVLEWQKYFNTQSDTESDDNYGPYVKEYLTNINSALESINNIKQKITEINNDAAVIKDALHLED